MPETQSARPNIDGILEHLARVASLGDDLPDPATPLNDFRESFYARREEAKARFGSVDAEAARIWIVNGPPADEYRTDCGIALWPIEIRASTTFRGSQSPCDARYLLPSAGS